MKSLIFFLAIMALAFSQVFDPDLEDSRGCIIEEKEGKCCWRNPNGCCKPPEKGQMCTQAFKTCCKTKVFDEETQTYKYIYN